MNLYKEASDAWSKAWDRYMTSKKEIIVFVFPCKIGRTEFFTVLSKTEALKYKVSTDKAWYCFGQSESDQQKRKELQARIFDPTMEKIHAYANYAKTLRQHLRAEEKLNKLRADDAT